MNAPIKSVPDGLWNASQAVFDLYHKYEKLRALTQHLNGLPDSAPLPDHIKISSISMNYSVNGIGSTASVSATEIRVGDVYRLLSKEQENIVAEIRTQAAEAKQFAAIVEQTCTNAQYTTNVQQARGGM